VTPAELARRLRSAPARAGATRVLAVDGHSGTGKTTLATRLGFELAAPVLPMDDLYPGWDGLRAGAAELIAGVLRPLRDGRPGRYRRWDWTRDAYAGTVDVPVVPVLVVEGAGCGVRAAAPYLSLLVWLDAPVAVRRERGLARDGEGFRPHWDRWARQEEALFAAQRTRERADVLVDVLVDADARQPGGVGGGW
jgi:hypothetical protein